jgi:hypothetical protein
MTTKLTYFKPSGKFYSTGSLDHNAKHVDELKDIVAKLRNEQKLPGLMEGHSPFIVMFALKDVPCLIL